MKSTDRRLLYLAAAWFIVNLLQSVFTGLHSDESYYWMYSRNLDWGYFDHPPMAAFFIYLGTLVLPGEAGVRIVIILLSAITFALIMNQLRGKQDLYFTTIFMLSFPLVHTHISGFMAIPDVPLLFFTVLFLLLYRQFLEKPGPAIALFLGIVAAAMIYSKYHAILVIGLTVLSNIRLLRNKYFWMTAGITTILLVPHIYWQFDNGFPTFRYHLVERAKPFRLKHVTDYLLNQLVMAGPLTGILVFWKLGKFRIKNAFDRMLIFNIAGFYLLFFLMSFKNRIEAHWTAAIFPMLMMAVFPAINQDAKVKKWFTRLAIPVIILMFLYRIYLALDIIPNVGHLKITFYNRQASALEIKEMAGGKKVGFFDNYAAISNYIFYTGDSAVHLSTPTYRFHQYDLWDDESYAAGETVFAIQPKHLQAQGFYKTAAGETKGYTVIEEYFPLKDLRIEIISNEMTVNGYRIEILIHNEGNKTFPAAHISEPAVCIMQNRKELAAVPLKTAQTALAPGNQAGFVLLVDANQVEPAVPLIIYTRTKENIRGRVMSIAAD